MAESWIPVILKPFERISRCLTTLGITTLTFVMQQNSFRNHHMAIAQLLQP